MDGKEKRSMFQYGALGGALPTLATLASTYVANPSEPFPALGLYFGLALWAIIGGAVALTNSTPEMRQAIFAGMAAPAILMNVISGATEANMQRKIVGLWPQVTVALGVLGFGQIQPANAAEVTPSEISSSGIVTGKGTALMISAEVFGGRPVNVDIPVVAEVMKAGKTESISVGSIKGLWGTSAFSVPDGTMRLTVYGKEVPLVSPVTDVNITVNTSPTALSDFWWALGAPRTYAIDDVSVMPKK